MFGLLFGWRKASKCKRLIKKVQCRLKLLRSKRSAIAKQLREDISQLLRDSHESVAFDRLERLYMDENLKEVYELLENFCEFVVMNLPYIRKHRDCPNDVSEAVSSLVYASARFGELPELKAVRKLFGERYGEKFTGAAVDLLPGNLVNRQIQEKLSMESVPEDAKNRLLDEIIKDCFFRPGVLAIEYNPSPPRSKLSKPEIFSETQFTFPALESIEQCEAMKSYGDDEFALRPIDLWSIFPAEEEKSSVDYGPEYPDHAVVFIDDIEEFKSPARKDQDQRLFVFKPSKNGRVDEPARKRQRRRTMSKDTGCGGYHTGSPCQRKQKRDETLLDGPIQSFRFWLKEEEAGPPARRQSSISKKPEGEVGPPERRQSFTSKKSEGEAGSPARRQSSTSKKAEGGAGPPARRQSATSKNFEGGELPCPPYQRAVRTPEQGGGGGAVEGSRSVGSSPRHVHPKLPDYDELEARFMAMKRVHQESKFRRGVE